MIKQWPGWLNFLFLSAVYAIVVLLLRHILRSQCEDWFVAILVFTYAGAYLAKWRYHREEGWKFW